MHQREGDAGRADSPSNRVGEGPDAKAAPANRIVPAVPNPVAPLPPLPQPPPASPPEVASHNAIQRDFLWKVHDYTNNYIRFADTKAAFAIGFASALISAMFGANLHRYLLTGIAADRIDWFRTLIGCGTIAAFALLAFGVVFGALAVLPRLWDKHQPNFWWKLAQLFRGRPTNATGYVFWEMVQAHGSADAFWNGFHQRSEVELNEAIARHLFVLAGISFDKFRFVTWSIMSSFVGAMLAVATIVLSFR
jgi:hypothetical protein